MASLNKVYLMGNLCRDVEVRSVGSTSVAKIRLAVNESYTAKSGEKVEKTVYVDIDAWDKLGENCARMVGKGSSILVEGKLQLDEWEDRETGKKRSHLKVRADRVTFLTFKDGERGAGDGEPPASEENNSQGKSDISEIATDSFDQAPPVLTASSCRWSGDG